MAARYFVDWTNLLLTCEGVADNNIASHPSASEYLLDSVIILLVANKRQQGLAVWISIPLQYRKGRLIQWHLDCQRMPSFSLACDIVHFAIDDVGCCQRPQVAYSTANAAMEHEDVALHLKTWTVTQVGILDLAALFNAYIIGRAIDVLCDLEPPERVVGGQALIDCPDIECLEFLEESINRILATLPRETALRHLFNNHRELQEQLMLIPDVVFKVMQQQLVKAIESQFELGVE